MGSKKCVMVPQWKSNPSEIQMTLTQPEFWKTLKTSFLAPSPGNRWGGVILVLIVLGLFLPVLHASGIICFIIIFWGGGCCDYSVFFYFWVICWLGNYINGMTKWINILLLYQAVSQICSWCALGTEDLKEGCYVCCLSVGKVGCKIILFVG